MSLNTSYSTFKQEALSRQLVCAFVLHFVTQVVAQSASHQLICTTRTSTWLHMHHSNPIHNGHITQHLMFAQQAASTDLILNSVHSSNYCGVCCCPFSGTIYHCEASMATHGSWFNLVTKRSKEVEHFECPVIKCKSLHASRGLLLLHWRRKHKQTCGTMQEYVLAHTAKTEDPRGASDEEMETSNERQELNEAEAALASARQKLCRFQKELVKLGVDSLGDAKYLCFEKQASIQRAKTMLREVCRSNFSLKMSEKMCRCSCKDAHLVPLSHTFAQSCSLKTAALLDILRPFLCDNNTFKQQEVEDVVKKIMMAEEDIFTAKQEQSTRKRLWEESYPPIKAYPRLLGLRDDGSQAYAYDIDLLEVSIAFSPFISTTLFCKHNWCEWAKCR